MIARKPRNPVVEATSAGIRNVYSVRPAMTIVSRPTNVAASGEPNSSAKIEPMPACVIRGARPGVLMRSAIQGAAAATTARSGASGPRLAPTASEMIEARTMPGSGRKPMCVSPTPCPAVGRGPPWPGAKRTTSPTAAPPSVVTASANQGCGSTPSASGTRCQSSACSPCSAQRNASAAIAAATPSNAANAISFRYSRLRR